MVGHSVLRTPHSLALVGNTSKSKVGPRHDRMMKADPEKLPDALIASLLSRDYAESHVTERHAKPPLRGCGFA